jgi:hypothetical protein
VQPLPKLDLPNNAPERGWRKLTVFKKDFGGLSGISKRNTDELPSIFVGFFLS